MFKQSQFVAFASYDHLVRVEYKNVKYQILGLAGQETVKNRDPDFDIYRFNSRGKLLGFRMALKSRVLYLIFPHNTFSLEVLDREKLIASSVWKDAGESWGKKWDQMK